MIAKSGPRSQLLIIIGGGVGAAAVAAALVTLVCHLTRQKKDNMAVRAKVEAWRPDANMGTWQIGPGGAPGAGPGDDLSTEYSVAPLDIHNAL